MSINKYYLLLIIYLNNYLNNKFTATKMTET